MSEPVRIVVPPSVTPYVKPDAPLEIRLKGAGGEQSLPAREELMLLFCLSKDKDHHVRALALHSLESMQYDRISCIDGWYDLHPAVIHAVATVQGKYAPVREILLDHPAIAEPTKKLLLSMPSDGTTSQSPPLVESQPDNTSAQNENRDDPPSENNPEEPDAAQPHIKVEDDEEEEYYSKYQLAQVMGIGEKIKMALTGDKEWRKILIKDSNKLVSGGVLKNPRITEPEVLNVLKTGTVNDEIMRLICENKEWVKNYPIRKALVEHPKTPLASALRFLGTMNDKDVSNYARSRNISSVISTQAKRMILSKQNKR